MNKTYSQIENYAFDYLQTKNTGYMESEDVWYGPNAAVCQTSMLCALIGCYNVFDIPITNKENSQWTMNYIWSWVKDGYWPCSLYWSYEDDISSAITKCCPHKIIVL